MSFSLIRSGIRSVIRSVFISLVVAFSVLPLSGMAESQRCLHHPLVAPDSDVAASSWAIDLLSYDDSDQADALVGRLAKKQFIAAVTTEQEHGALRYQVRMSGFSSHDDALNCQLLLQEKTSIRDQHIRLIPPIKPIQSTIGQHTPVQHAHETVSDAVPQQDDDSGQRVNGMSISQAIDFALKHNVQYREQVSQLPILDLDVAAASDPFSVKSNIASSSNQRVGSELGRDYHLNLSKKFSPGTNVGIGFGTSRFAGQSLSEASLSVTQPLLKGRGTLVNTIGIEEAAQNRLKQRNMIHSQQQRLILDVITAYYRTGLQQQSMRIHEATIKHSKSMLDSSSAKFKFGMVSRMDVFRAEIQMLESEESLASARSAYEKSMDDLKLLLGASLTDDISLSDPIRKQIGDIDEDATLVEQALHAKPELVNLKLEQDMLIKRIEVAKNNLLPQIDVSLQVTQSGSASTFSKSTHLNDTRMGVGISGSPDFSNGSAAAQNRRHLLAYDFAQQQYRQMEELCRR